MPSTIEKSSPRRGRPGVDADAWHELTEGLSATQVAQLFGTGRDAAHRRLRGVAPVGTRGGTMIYRLVDVVSLFIAPTEAAIRAFLESARPADLPGGLSVALVRAELLRLDLAERRGDLWPTDKVISVAGSMVRKLDMRLRLLMDSVERRSELSDTQRSIITSEINGARIEMSQDIRSLETERAAQQAALASDDQDDEEI